MKYLKSIFKLSIAAVVVLSASNAECESGRTGFSINSSSIREAFVNGYTYERVLIDGVWWIYVYDSDGKLVNRYIEANE